jgi:CTD small phosphatase-like protein 2
MLDLDETLIHSVFDVKLPAEVKILSDGNEFRFNVRPHCFKFLENLSNHYEIYAFTASTKDYAEPIVKYLNKNNKTIQGVLHRKNCLETINGFKIKDLRIIKNRGL